MDKPFGMESINTPDDTSLQGVAGTSQQQPFASNPFVPQLRAIEQQDEPFVRRCTVWQGVLEYNDVQKVTHPLTCKFKSRRTSRQILKAEMWPEQLGLKLFRFNSIERPTLSRIIRSSPHNIIIHFNKESEALLSHIARPGLVGFIDFPAPAATDRNMILVVCHPDRHIYTGLPFALAVQDSRMRLRQQLLIRVLKYGDIQLSPSYGCGRLRARSSGNQVEKGAGSDLAPPSMYHRPVANQQRQAHSMHQSTINDSLRVVREMRLLRRQRPLPVVNDPRMELNAGMTGNHQQQSHQSPAHHNSMPLSTTAEIFMQSNAGSHMDAGFLHDYEILRRQRRLHLARSSPYRKFQPSYPSSSSASCSRGVASPISSQSPLEKHFEELRATKPIHNVLTQETLEIWRKLTDFTATAKELYAAIQKSKGIDPSGGSTNEEEKEDLLCKIFERISTNE